MKEFHNDNNVCFKCKKNKKCFDKYVVVFEQFRGFCVNYHHDNKRTSCDFRNRKQILLTKWQISLTIDNENESENQ